jgi:threonine/homoserine/homoserine lactone efflux protein
MTIAPSLIAFLAAAGLLTITPGVDTALVLRTASAQGRGPAALAAAGIGVGCMIWGGAVGLGLGALLGAAPLAFTALTWAGAAYLVWVGASLIWRPRRGLSAGGAAGARPGDDRMAPLRWGLFTNLLNPKIGVFYVSFLPQFVPTHVAAAPWMVMLAALHVAMSLVWFAALIAATVPISRFLARPGVVTGLDRLTGCVFIAFGARLVLARRA